MSPDPEDAFRGGPAPGAARGAVPGGGDLVSAVDASPLPMLLVDPHRPGEPIVLANAAFSRMTGYGPSEIIGRNCRFLQGPGSDPDVIDRIRHAIRSRTELAVEILNYRKDGSPFRNALYLSPVHDAGGDLVLFLASQVDLSSSGQGGVERIPPVPREARIGDIAHDLGNMLQVITGYMVDVERHAAASGDARLIRRAKAIAEAAGRAVDLVEELRAVWRGDAPREPSVDPARGEAPGPLRPSARGPSAGARILVVDDRAEIADLARAMLESLGYRVEVARDGQAALDRLPAGFDLLFTDLLMPGAFDGLGLAHEARRRHPGLKVVITTGDADGAAGRGGEFPAIVKPYRQADLADMIRSVLDGPASA